jgi:hypothetical protein
MEARWSETFKKERKDVKVALITLLKKSRHAPSGRFSFMQTGIPQMISS